MMIRDYLKAGLMMRVLLFLERLGTGQVRSEFVILAPKPTYTCLILGKLLDLFVFPSSKTRNGSLPIHDFLLSFQFRRGKQ